MRFDPVWRRIKPDLFTTKLEGQFPTRLSRLDDLNNWGSLGWLYGHANASKQAHHFGLEWNAIKFLDGADDRAKHKPSFRTAAHVSHWGHLPLSYAGEEGLLRAAHVSPSIKASIETVISDVIAFGSLSCDLDGHQCAAEIRSGDRPFDLYRWLSAWLVKKDWKRVWKAIKSASDEIPDEADTKAALIETLVCKQSRGFTILKRCNQADYVPRDLLQAGTAWLTFDIEALWEGNPLGTDAAKEWSLIDAAQSYLNDRFFHSPDALLFHSLAARAIAGGLLATGVTTTSLTDLTNAGDEYVLTTLKQYHRRRLTALKSQSSRITERWALVGSFSDVSLDTGSRLEMEDQLSGAGGRNRVSYPFNTGLSIIVEPDAGPHPVGLNLAARGLRLATVHIHQETRHEHPTKGRSVLDVVSKINDRAFPGNELGDNLLSWLVQHRVEQRSPSVDRMCGEILTPNADQLRSHIAEMMGVKSLQEILKNPWLSGILDALRDPSFPLDKSPGAAGVLLQLPWSCLKLAPGQAILDLLRQGGIEKSVSASGAYRGYALEVAVAADQLMKPRVPYRFVFKGATQLGKDGQPTHEWDVLRLDLDSAGEWNLTAAECAIARNNSKDEDSRTKLTILQDPLVGRFTDFTEYRTLLATVAEDDIQYEDAGRSWHRAT